MPKNNRFSPRIAKVGLREGEKSLFKEYFLSWWNSGSWKKPYIFPLDVVMVR